MVGAFAHAGIFWVRENKKAMLDRVLKHKEAIISHLAVVSFILGPWACMSTTMW